MHDLTFLYQLAVIFGVAVVVVVLLGRIGLPSIAGMLVAGVLMGPNGLGLITSVEDVEVLAEVGVVLLLFTIGLELSLDRLRRIWRLVTIGGGVQVTLTVLAAAGLAMAMGRSFSQGIFFGFLLALSSTAIVLRALSERDEMDAPHGRLILGVLIFQDLSVVPMMLLVPMLAGGDDASPLAVASALGGAAVMVVAVVGGARLVVPRILHIVAAERKRDLFVLTVLLICLGTAWLTSLAGLSLALGAFLAGIVLAGSGYRHQAMSDILPFRDAFTSLFFISVGMLLDLRIIVEEPLLIGGMFLAALLGKFIIATIAGLVMRFPFRVALLTGIGLAQVGEFSFVLVKAGEQAGLLTGGESRLFLTAGVMTMLVTPVLVRLAPHLAAGMTRLNPLVREFGTLNPEQELPSHKGLTDHVIIAGFGLGGRILAGALKSIDIPYVVLDLNPVTVDTYQKQGEPIYYGDVTSTEVLNHVNCSSAREVVVVISDPEAARRCIAAVRHHDPEQHITVRTRYFDEIAELKKLGATDMVVEEFENAVELMARVLRRAGTPRNVIAARIGEARESREELVRPLTIPRQRLEHHAELMREVKIDTYLLGGEDWAAERSLRDINLRAVTHTTIVALRRDGAIIPNPPAGEVLLAGDIVYMMGEQPAVTASMQYLGTGTAPPPVDSAPSEKEN